jgi:sugar/nucleoside kinase (ribokinase family)
MADVSTRSHMTIDLLDIAHRVSTADLPSCRVVTGFDGFVDEMISLVGERRALDDFTPVPDISTFATMIASAAGQSSLREIVVTAVQPGGCAVNLADGLASLGATVDCFATIGDPPHPAFGDIAAKCHRLSSWGPEPGRTLAFEFNDGKLMFSAVEQLAGFTPHTVRELLADGTYAAACEAAHVIALTDWSLYPAMTPVWGLLQHEVFSALTHRPAFFVDLVDPSTRSVEDIRDMAAALREFEPVGPVTLGLNGTEANALCRAHGTAAAPSDATTDQTLDQAVALREVLGVSRVVIHRVPFAVSATLESATARPGPYSAEAKMSTGAGDRFNAGFCLGLALGFDDGESLMLGCAASGFFVRNARSASRQELIDFLEHWAAGAVDHPG